MRRDSAFGIRNSGEPSVFVLLNSTSSNNSPTTSVAGGGAFQPWKCDGRKAEVAVVASVSVEVAAFVPGVTLSGENEHVERAGRLEQPNAMGPGKEPDRGATVTL